jgi:hypothetical protein
MPIEIKRQREILPPRIPVLVEAFVSVIKQMLERNVADKSKKSSPPSSKEVT